MHEASPVAFIRCYPTNLIKEAIILLGYLLLAYCLVLHIGTTALAQSDFSGASNEIAFQGVLRNNVGTLVDGDADVTGTFRIGTTGASTDLSVAGDAYIDGPLGINTATMTADLTVNGDANIDGPVGVGTDSPVNHFHVRDFTTSTSGAELTGYVGVFENTRTTGGPDGVAIKINSTGNPDTDSNFLGFFDAEGLVGEIEGNGAGNVQFNGPGADYAEFLPLLDRDEQLEAGDVVGVFDGHITHRTEGATQVMAITDRAIVVGNRPRGSQSEEDFREVSFIGQIPVWVVGPVDAGDYVIASGRDNGTAIAVSPGSISLKDISQLVGRAWEENPNRGRKRVNTAVGLDRSDVLVEILKRQEERITRLEQMIGSSDAGVAQTLSER